MVIRFAPDGRVFVARRRSSTSSTTSADPTPTRLRRPALPGARLLGPGPARGRARPQFTTGRPYVYVLYAYDKDRTRPSAALGRRLRRRLPAHRRRLRDHGPPLATERDGHRAGADRGLVPAVPEPLRGHAGLRAGRRPVRRAPGRRLASTTPTTARTAARSTRVATRPAASAPTPPTAEGGALRSQTFRRPATETASLDGSILRVNPDTGAAGRQPGAASPDPQRRRIVAYGFRNPFRFTFRPARTRSGRATWAGTRGRRSTASGRRPQVRNYGWPCYEGTPPMGCYDSLNLDLCESLYTQGSAAVARRTTPTTTPLRSWPTRRARPGSSSISGLASTPATRSRRSYRTRSSSRDYSRNCIWVMLPGANGLPDPAKRADLRLRRAGPVDLRSGPAARSTTPTWGGTIRRIAARQPRAAAAPPPTPDHGAAPLTVTFDGTASTDPEASALTYAWDLDGDGAYDDSTAAAPVVHLHVRRQFTVRLRVTDPGGLSGTDPRPRSPRARRRRSTIASPTSGTTWAVGDTIVFSGYALDGAGRAVPGLSADVGAQPAPLLARRRDSCHTHASRTTPAWSQGASSRPITSTRRACELR